MDWCRNPRSPGCRFGNVNSRFRDLNSAGARALSGRKLSRRATISGFAPSERRWVAIDDRFTRLFVTLVSGISGISGLRHHHGDERAAEQIRATRCSVQQLFYRGSGEVCRPQIDP